MILCTFQIAFFAFPSSFATEFHILENNAVLKEVASKKKNFRTEIKMLHIEDYGKFGEILFYQTQSFLIVLLFFICVTTSP